MKLALISQKMSLSYLAFEGQYEVVEHAELYEGPQNKTILLLSKMLIRAVFTQLPTILGTLVHTPKEITYCLSSTFSLST